MTLNVKIEVFMDFWRFWAERHISRANCVEFTTDRPRKDAYEIFSIERRFQRFKLLFARFKESCAWGHQRAVPHRSRFCRYWQVYRENGCMDMLPITTSPSDELFSRINIDDFERPWTPKIRGFIVVVFSKFRAAHYKSELRRNGWK